MGTPGHPVHAAVLARLDDRDWVVRHQLAASLGTLPADSRNSAMATLLGRHADDPITLDAALSGLHGSEMAVLEHLLQAGDASTPQLEAAATMFAATIVRGEQDADVQKLLDRVADAGSPGWQRGALLRGAEIAVLGATMPGMPARRGGPATAAAAPCPTCPGARGGPGGAYAFPQAPPTARGRGSRTLRLRREPSALAALAAGGGELGGRARTLLARVEWPGKAGAPAPAAPLTPDEQQRFDTGREVYRNVCQACHQPDGRGMEKLAPSLLESPFVLGPPDVPVRILLHGKEGTTGLMPPVGQAFTDDQIAAVLTYIRREWGQSGAPIDAATVRDIRARAADRARPWTEKELTGFLGGAGR